MNRLDKLIETRTEARRKTASTLAQRIVTDAGAQGLRVSIVGSLARGQFKLHSDVDLLVLDRVDAERRAALERIAAGHLRGTGIPYDIIYAGDLSPARIREFSA